MRRRRYRRLIDRERGIVVRVSFELLRWIWRFPRHVRPRVLEILDRHRDTTQIVVLRSRRQARRDAAEAGARHTSGTPL